MITLKSVNAVLPRLDYLRLHYSTDGYFSEYRQCTGKLRFAIIDYDPETGEATGFEAYNFEGARSEKHAKYIDCIDVRDIIADWLEGSYGDNPRAARKMVVRDIRDQIQAALRDNQTEED